MQVMMITKRLERIKIMDIEYLKMITEDQKVSVLYEHAEAYMLNLIEHGSKDEIAFLYESYQDRIGNKVKVSFSDE